MRKIQNVKISLIRLDGKNERKAILLISPKVSRWIEPISLGKKDDIRKWVKNMASSKNYTYLIKNKKPLDYVGMIWLEKINKVNREGEIGFFIGEKFQGKGFAKRAAELLIEFSFSKLRLKKIIAITNNFNKPSQKLISKLGFILEKNIKKDYEDKLTGRWCDVLIYGLVNERVD